MYTRQYTNPRNHVSNIKSTLNDFLNRINYSNIYQLPCNNNPRVLAAQAIIGKRIQKLTGIGLLKRNLRRESQRLQLHNQYLLSLAANRIWRLKFTRSERERFTNLASHANYINQITTQRITTLDRIEQIDLPQATNN